MHFAQYMLAIIVLTLFRLAFCQCLLDHEIQFKGEKISTGVFINETSISQQINNQEVGSISYTKIPLLAFYIIHTFYVYPEFRNKGYGTQLLLYTCDLLKHYGTKRIYIQPGPFEMQDTEIEAIDKNNILYHCKIQKLIKMYERAGFSFTNKFISRFAYCLYKILGIHEDSRYLMAMVLN